MDKLQTFTDKLTRPRIAILMLILGAVAAVLSSARFGLGFFAWIWPIFVLIFFRQGNLKRKWLWFLPLFIGANTISTQETVPFPVPVLAVISTLYALILGLIFQLDRWLIRRQDHFLVTLFLPAAFVTREYLDARGGGGIWGSIANSQLGFSWFSQLASITGIFGISFMIYWLASVVVWIMSRIRSHQTFRYGALSYCAIFLLVLIYGASRYEFNPAKLTMARIGGISVPSFQFIESLYEDYSGKKETLDPKSSPTSPRLAEMQKAYLPFIETADTVRFARGYRAMKTMQDSLLRLTTKAADGGAKIVVWSEGNGFVFPFDEEAFLNRAKLVALENKIWLLMTMAVIHPGKVTPEKKWLENKAILIRPGGDVANVLHKNKPVPYAEASEPGDGRIPAIPTSFGTISTSICYDADFPIHMQQMGKQHTDLLLLPSGDWWAIDPYHSHMAVFRGIENGSSVFRQVSGGLSMATDYTGRRFGSMDFYTEGEKIWWADLPIGHHQTIYSLIGDLFSYLCIGISLAGLVIILSGINKKSIPTLPVGMLPKYINKP